MAASIFDRKADKKLGWRHLHTCHHAEEYARSLYGRHQLAVFWNCLAGWHLTDLGKPVKSWPDLPSPTKLKKCPFCDINLASPNEVDIT